MSDNPTLLDFEEHFEHCEGSLYDGDDFVIWLAEHDHEVAKAERGRILKLLKAHSNETWEEYNNHEDGCDLCQNYYGIGVAIKLIEGE